MAEIPASVRKNVQTFLKAVGSRYRVYRAYVYGSQVQGRATRWSDIDVAVVSPDFSDDLFQERLALMRIAATIDDRIEPAPFDEESFEDENDPLTSEIRRHGIRMM